MSPPRTYVGVGNAHQLCAGCGEQRHDGIVCGPATVSVNAETKGMRTENKEEWGVGSCPALSKHKHSVRNIN